MSGLSIAKYFTFMRVKITKQNVHHNVCPEGAVEVVAWPHHRRCTFTANEDGSSEPWRLGVRWPRQAGIPKLRLLSNDSADMHTALLTTRTTRLAPVLWKA